MTTAEVREQVLAFEGLSNRYQYREWAAALERLTALGAEPFLRLLAETGADKEERPIRWALALILGRVGDPAAVESLCRLMDDFPAVQATAAWALGQIGDPRAVDALVARLSTGEDPKVVRQVADALAKIGDERALGPLRALVSEVRNRGWGGVFTPKSLEHSLDVLEAGRGMGAAQPSPAPDA